MPDGFFLDKSEIFFYTSVEDFAWQTYMPRRFVVTITIGLSFGIILRDFLSWGNIALMSGLFIVLAHLYSKHLLSAVLVVCLFIGAGRSSLLLGQAAKNTTTLITTNAEVHGLVTRIWTLDGRTTVELRRLQVGQHRIATGAQVQFSYPPKVSAGDIVRVQCRWDGPKSKQIFRMYSQGLEGFCFSPELFESTGHSSHWRASLARWRAFFVERVQQSYHHPQVDLLAGILFGVQETMDQNLRQEFRATGTSHIVALSGFNITIIVSVLAGALTALIGRRLALVPTLVVICAFVVMTGASASVTRAAIMSVIGLIALQLGRPLAASRLLLYTYGGMVVVNPFILLHDLGFQLSFLATIGLIYVSPFVTERLTKIPEWFELRSTLASTLAAMLVTEPLLLWTFGRFSIVAPLVNVLVLPSIPLIMAAGAIGLFIPFAVPLTDGLLRFVLGTIGTASQWPWSQISLPWWGAGMLASLCVMIMVHFVYVAAKQTSPNR